MSATYSQTAQQKFHKHIEGIKQIWQKWVITDEPKERAYAHNHSYNIHL